MLDWVGCSLINLIRWRMHWEIVLVRVITVLGPTVAAGHDEDCIRPYYRVWHEHRFYHPVTEYLELGKSHITLFFRDLCAVIPVSVSVLAQVENSLADHLNLM